MPRKKLMTTTEEEDDDLAVMEDEDMDDEEDEAEELADLSDSEIEAASDQALPVRYDDDEDEEAGGTSEEEEEEEEGDETSEEEEEEEGAEGDADTVTEPVLPRKHGLVPASERITKPFLTKYEKTRIIATRAQQIAQGAMPLISFEDGRSEPAVIAEEELRQKKTPLMVRRTLPDGSYEDWQVDELEDIYLD